MERTILKRVWLVGVIFAVTITFTVGNPVDASIALINPSFEQGLTGWTAAGNGTASAVTQLIDGSYTYRPPDGNYFLQMVAPAKNTFLIYQEFNALQGDILRGWAGMVSPVNNGTDWAYVATTIYMPTGVVWFSAVSTNGWQSWEWTSPATSRYGLEFIITNLGSSPSTAVYDLPESFGAQVPIPTTLLLLAAGLMGLIAIRRKNVHWVR